VFQLDGNMTESPLADFHINLVSNSSSSQPANLPCFTPQNAALRATALTVCVSPGWLAD
jgi:hypothetical protein